MTPNQSPLRPHCVAGDRIRLWQPVNARTAVDSLGRPIPLTQRDLERIEGVSLKSLQPGTQASYGTGLLAFHVFCDHKKIAEEMRAPVDILVLQSFVATLAGLYSASTISSYVAAVRTWHIVHSIPWNIGGPEIDATVKGAKVMAPKSATRDKREPMTVDYIETLRPHFSDTVALDVAVFACLTSAFWSTARLGELTVQNLAAFNPVDHVKRSDLGERVDRNGLKTTTIRVPKTKANPTQGEDLYWAKQNGPSDPESALQRHLELNIPDKGFHLFGYKDGRGKMIPLTKTNFLKRMKAAATSARLSILPGHSIRIGSTLEYLLRGVPFDVMKAKGRWSSDAFHQYLRDHATILAPYMQAAPPDSNDHFIRIAIPSVRD